MTVALILLAGLTFGVLLLGLIALIVVACDPHRVLGELGETWLLWGVGLVVVGSVGVLVVVATLK